MMESSEDNKKTPVVFLLPGLIVGVYLAFDHPRGQLPDWSNVVGIAILMTVGSFLAGWFTAMFAEWLLDPFRRSDVTQPPPSPSWRSVLTGVLIFTGCWVWHRVEYRVQIGEITRCVHFGLDPVTRAGVDTAIRECASDAE